MADQYKKPHPGVRQISLALDPSMSFKDIVAVLERTLTVPELPGIRGCAPCLSGIDRIIVEDFTLPAIR
jgi:hypothetical protein